MNPRLIVRGTTEQRSTVISRENLELPLFFDRCFDKNRIKTFIGWLLANFGENATVYVVEKLKNLGFYFATEAGISLSIDDLQIPSNKNQLLSQAEKDIKKNSNYFQCGNLTPVEQSQQLLDRWHRTSETLRESVIQSFRLTNTLNPVYMMAFSGARGNISQVRQLVGMRGLMADPQGQIISFPIRSNFREGLTLTEYIISCYGARKGVVDTALRTADSGYLTRRLVDVSQHVVVWTFDCKTDAGIHLTEMKEGRKTILSLKKRILGRVLAQEIPPIAFRNQQISAQLAQQIVSLKEHVLVRSPLSCSLPNSVCQLCYGWSLSRGRIVSLGEAVGVIAAQSIGEPGTQLTMRTFHTGGVFSGDVIDEIRAPHDGVVRFLHPLLGQLIRTSHGRIAYLTRANGSFVIEKNSKNSSPVLRTGVQSTQESVKSDSISEDIKRYADKPKVQVNSISQTIIALEPGTALFIRQGEKVVAKQLLAEYSSISAQTNERVEAQHQVYSDQKGEIFFDNVILGKKLKKEEPETEKESILNPLGVSDVDILSGTQNKENSLQNKVKQGERLDQQSRRKIDIVTSLKLNTLWILSGTFFEPAVPSPLYVKIGDLVDKTTLLTVIQSKLNLQTSHLDGDYILSAQLKEDKILKKKEKLLTFFNKNLVSNQFSKNSQKETFFLQRRNWEDKIKKRDSLFLNKFSLNLIITNIRYKKSGYFFTSYKKEKTPDFYSLFLQARSVNLFYNLTNLKNNKENNRLLNWDLSLNITDASFSQTRGFKESKLKGNFSLGQGKTDFPGLLKSYTITKDKQKILAGNKSQNLFIFDIDVDGDLGVLTDLKKSPKIKDLWLRTRENLVTLKEIKRPSLFKEWSVLKRNKVENKKNVNHFFTTTALNQPFSNGREFKNEFILQSFAPRFKTETGGLIYTNNHYLNKRSTEAQIFFMAEQNYGKKNLGKMNFGMRKKSFHIVSFKELMTPSICLTNVALNGKNKPNSSFKNSLLSSSENLANALFTNKSVQIKGASNIADRLSFSTERFLQDKNARDNKVLFISSLLNKICFLQNQDFKKDIFLLRKKEDLNLYSAYFHSKKRKTSNITINFLKKGFLSFKNKWVETDIPLGYQKNLQGSQIPFYSTENGVLRNNLASSFFTNQYSTYWRRRKRQKSSVSFLKPFLPLTSKSPSPYLQVKKRPLSVKNAFFINNLDLNQNKFFGESGNFIKNFNSRPIKERLYQKEFCLIDQQRKETILKETPAIGGVDKKSGLMQPLFYRSSRKPSFFHNKDRIRFSLAFLLQKCHLNFTRNKSFLFASQKERGLDVLTGSKRKAPLSETTYRGNKRIPLKFNPFPSKGNSLSSAFTFEINLRAVQFCDFRKEGLLFYNSYPYPQPLFVEFLQNKSTADFYYLAKSLNIHFDLQKKHVLLQRKPVFSESSPLTLQKQIKKRFIKKHRKTDENLERSNLQVRPGWLYLPKNQLQTAQAHQSFTLPFQQNLDEILFDQFPVYIESILRKNFEEQLADKYLQPSTNTVDCGKANTFVEKSKLQKFINKISPLYASSIPNTKEKRHKNHFLMRKEGPNRFLLSLRETFWRGSTFSSVIENDFTTFSNKNKNLSKLSKEDLSYQTNLPTNSLNHTPISNTSLFISFLLRNKKKRKTNYLRDKKVFPVQSTEVQSTQNVFDADLFSFTEKKETQNKGQQHTILQPFNQTGNENIINEKDNVIDKGSSDQTSEYFEFHSKNPSAKPIESLPNSSSQKEEFSLDRKEIFSSAEHRAATHPRNSTLKFKGETKEPNIGNISPQPVYKKEKEKEKFLFLRTVSINPIKIGFQVVTNKSSRFNSIQSFALSCVNDIDFGFSQNFFLQSQIITKDLGQTEVDIYIKRNPKSFFCLPQISRIYFVKNKPFSDFVLVSRKFTFDRQTFSENQDNVDVLSETEKKETLPHTFLQGKNVSSKVESTKNSQEGLIEKVRLSEKNKNLLCKENQILVNTNEKPNKYKNLPKILQNKAFLIQNFSPKVDTNYSSFLVLIPTFLKESANTTTNTVNTIPLSETQNKEKDSQKKTYNFPVQTIQKRKYSFSTLFCQKSKLWLLIRQAAEYPLLDTSISQQKTKLHQANQPFFEKELTYSSTPLSLYMSNRVIFSSKFNKQKRDEICLSFYNSPKVNLKIRENTFHLLRAFSQLEKQDFANLSEHFVKQNVDSSKTKFLQGKNLKLPHNLFSCQKVFWNLFGLHYQNLQKNKLFERKEPLFIKKTFDIEEKDSLTENLSFKSDFGVDVLSETEKKEIKNNKGTLFSQTHIKSGENVYKGQEDKGNHLLFNGEEKGFPNKTWFFQKEIANIPQARQLDGLKNNEIEHFDNQNVLATKYRETLEDIVSFQEKEETIIRSFKQSYLLDFLLNFTISKQSPLQRLEIKTTFEKIDGNTQVSSCTHCVNLQGFEKGSRKKDNSDRADNLDFVPQNVSDRKQKNEFFQVQSIQNWHNVKIQTLRSKGNQNQLKSWQYSFTPFARDLSFTLSFTAKLNQSWFFSLATNVKNKLRDFSLEEKKSLTSLQSSIFQNKEVKNQPFIGANSGFAQQNQPLVNQNRTKQKYLKDKKLFSKQNSSYPLKERNSYTTLLLDQTLTISDKTPVATTALISREEGEIENIKSDSACLILRNSDIEILLTKGKNPIVVVGQLIRYGEEIANGVAAPKSGQIIQVDTNKVTLRKAQPILFPRGGSIDVSHGDYVKEGSPLLSLSYQRLVTGDIVQGIPKIEQLFEARETEGGQPLLSNLHNELEAIFLSYRTQLGLRLAVRESFKDIQQIIVDRVQRVYIAQGVLIADKHFEVVIRQMTSKVRILDGGRPGFLYGELVDLRRVELLNAGVPFSNEQAIYEPIILGISKACLEAEGFLSPASFQETTRVLSLAAIERKTDFLRGIKERVILGDVIQAGTGFTLYDRPVRKIKQEKCIDLSLSVLQNAHSTLSSNQYYKQL